MNELNGNKAANPYRIEVKEVKELAFRLLFCLLGFCKDYYMKENLDTRFAFYSCNKNVEERNKVFRNLSCLFLLSGDPMFRFIALWSEVYV